MKPVPIPEIIRRLQPIGLMLDSVVNVSFEMLIKAEVEVASVLRLPSIRNLYAEKYDREIKRRTLIPIEDLPEDAKKHYWKESAVYESDRERRIEAAKIVYLIDEMCRRELEKNPSRQTN